MPRPPANVPTLTEIVEPAAVAPPDRLLEDPEVQGPTQAQQWADRVQARVDARLDAHVRARLAPVLARLTDTLIQEIRVALLADIHDIVTQALNEEAQRRADP